MYKQMTCPECGKEYGEKLTFCISCGARLICISGEIDDDIKTQENNGNAIGTDCYTDITEQGKTAEGLNQRKNIHITSNSGVIPDINELNPVSDEMEYHETEDKGFAALKIESRQKKNIFKRLGINAVSFGVTILMFCFIIVTFGSFVGRRLTDEKQINEFINRTDLLRLPAAELSFVDKDSYPIESDATLLDAIYTMSEGTGISKDNIRNIYNDSTIKDFISNIIIGYAGYIRTGEQPEKLTAEKIKQVYTDNIGMINTMIKAELTEHDINLAYNEIDKTSPVLDSISAEKLENSMISAWITPFRLYISTPVLVAGTVLTFFMLIILITVNKDVKKALKWCGIPLIISGAAILCLTYLVSMRVMFGIIKSESVKMLLHSISEVISGEMYLTGACIAVLGILFVFLPGRVAGTN